MLRKVFEIVSVVSSISLLLNGCQKEVISTSSVGQKFTIMATAASTADTRTTLGEDLFVSWQQGDAISIACSNTGETLVEFTADAIGKTVPFTADATKLAEFTSGDNAQYSYYGLYPALFAHEWNGTAFRAMIPKNQAVTSNCPFNWDPRAVIAAGVCNGERPIMPFKNAHAIVKVILPQWDITEFTPISVMLMGNGADDVLAAEYWVTPSESGLPSLSLINNANSVRTVALTKPSFTPQETVYIAISPGTVHGMHLFVSSPTRTSRISTNTSITFEQNKIYEFDFSATEIKQYGVPVESHPHVPPLGDYIIVSTNGSTAYFQLTNDQSGQPDRWNSEIFEIIGGVYTPYQITTEKIIFIEKTSGPDWSYAVALMTANNSPIGWLVYDMEWQGSRLLRDTSFNPHNVRPNQIPSEATIYTIYSQQ